MSWYRSTNSPKASRSPLRTRSTNCPSVNAICSSLVPTYKDADLEAKVTSLFGISRPPRRSRAMQMRLELGM